MMEEKHTKPKELKEEIHGEIVRVRRGLSRTNLPVQLPENPTWLKQSNLVTMMAHDFKIIQIRVLIALIEKIQVAMEDSINKIPFEQMSLFSEFSDESKVIFNINYRDLGIEAYQYKEVKAALRQLATLPVEIDAVDPLTGAESWAISGLFKVYIPKETHQKRFSIEMEKEVAKVFVDVDRGFTRFIKELAYMTQSKYTARMYILVSSWKDKGGFSITVANFRKWLCMGNKYPKFKDVYKRIIRPAYEELFEKYNCWFEVAEIYRDGESEPYKLNFKVVKSALSKAEEEKLAMHKRMIDGMLWNHLRLDEKQRKTVLSFVHLGNTMDAVAKIGKLKTYVDKNFKKIKNISEYCYVSMVKYLEPIPGMIGENSDEIIESDDSCDEEEEHTQEN